MSLPSNRVSPLPRRAVNRGQCQFGLVILLALAIVFPAAAEDVFPTYPEPAPTAAKESPPVISFGVAAISTIDEVKPYVTISGRPMPKLAPRLTVTVGINASKYESPLVSDHAFLLTAGFDLVPGAIRALGGMATYTNETEKVLRRSFAFGIDLDLALFSKLSALSH